MSDARLPILSPLPDLLAHAHEINLETHRITPRLPSEADCPLCSARFRLQELIAAVEELGSDCDDPDWAVDGVALETDDEGFYIWPDGVRAHDDKRNYESGQQVPCGDCLPCRVNKALGKPLSVYRSRREEAPNG